MSATDFTAPAFIVHFFACTIQYSIQLFPTIPLNTKHFKQKLIDIIMIIELNGIDYVLLCTDLTLFACLLFIAWKSIDVFCVCVREIMLDLIIFENAIDNLGGISLNM